MKSQQSTLFNHTNDRRTSIRVNPKHRNSHPLVKTINASLPESNQDEDLPDIEGFGYGLQTKKGPAKVRPFWRKDAKSYWDEKFDHEEIPPNSSIIFEGADKYLKKYLLLKIENYPNFYSRMKQFETVYRWSADGVSHVIWDDIRRSIRLANGKGRFNSDEIDIALCAPGTLLTRGHRGVFLTELPKARGVSRRNSALPNPPTDVFHKINGIAIPEENPHLRQGFERFLDLTKSEKYPNNYAKPEKYSKFSNYTHHLSLSDGSTISLSREDLENLREYTKDQKEIATSHGTSFGNDTYAGSITKEDIPGNIGEEATLPPKETKCHSLPSGTILGYKVDWEKKTKLTMKGEKTTGIELKLKTLLLTDELNLITRQKTAQSIEI